MILELLGISRVMADTVNIELLAWVGLGNNNKSIKLIPLPIFWVIWKERNDWAFDGLELDFNTIKNNWFHYFGSTVLGYNLDSFDSLGIIIDMLIDM